MIKRQYRINDPQILNYELIENKINSGEHVIIQFSHSKFYNDVILQEADRLCIKYYENIAIRFYGHYSESFNCNWLKYLPNVKALHLDCLLKIENTSVLKSLEKLSEFSFGVFEENDPDILDTVAFHNLKTLFVTVNKNNNIDLKYIENIKGLKNLIVSGHTKNIDTIGKLIELEVLYLNSISKVSLAFINNLSKLKTLSILLGGRKNLDEIARNSIETLHIIRVRGFCEFSNINNFVCLKELLIEDQIKLQNIRFPVVMHQLEDVKLINCKTLKNLEGLQNIINLKQLRIYKTNLNIETLLSQKLSKELKIFAFYTAKKKIDENIENKLKKLGYKNGIE